MKDNDDKQFDIASKKYDWFVQQQAARLGKVFFTDSGEGRDTFHKGMYVEDISGWLIPIGKKDYFLANWERRYEHEFDKYYIFAEWNIDPKEQLTVRFKKYPISYN